MTRSTSLHVAALSRDELHTRATTIRDAQYGRHVTYSPKVFIPLTQLCRDKCGYCTFAQPPARLDSPYLDPDDVLSIARAGDALGCTEALFTLGELPELRYPLAQQWLTERGYSSTIDYLAAMCALVLNETTLLPHANAGALTIDELSLLRPVSASQGMMIETLRDDLDCHRGSPDKTPARRLATLDAAGQLAIPFTTGILVGIGENRTDRIEALEAIASSHRIYGHVQEVIVQNFGPKPRTTMFREQPANFDEFTDALALARNILPPDISLQAPPNLTDDYATLLSFGINDWGGVSPVTADHVNPERPWPELEVLEQHTRNEGFELVRRLTIYPRFASNPLAWLDPALHFPVLDVSDAESLSRDRDTAHERSGAEQWFSGKDADTPSILGPNTETNANTGAGRSRHVGPVADVLAGFEAGERLGEDEIVTLFRARGTEVQWVCNAADAARKEVSGDAITWVSNRNINYTNVCTFKCTFCGFSKGPLSLNLRGNPYLLTLKDIAARAVEAQERGATEVCLQGGIHPNFDGSYYLDVTKAVHEAAPLLHIHGFTALEVTEGAKRSEVSLDVYLKELLAAGLKTLPGTAAEILDDDVRKVLCSDKITTDEWLECHRVAHGVGLKSNVTIMFGSIESPRSWAKHLLATRDLQDDTGGFTEFVPLPFVHMASPIYLQKKSRRGPTFREVLLMHAIGRLAYHGSINNIQASWVKIGLGGVSQLLRSGVNDLGGTLMDENISRAAGAAHGQMATQEDFDVIAKGLGRTLQQRTTLYDTCHGSKHVTTENR